MEEKPKLMANIFLSALLIQFFSIYFLPFKNWALICNLK